MSEKMKLSVDTGSITVELEDKNGNVIGEFEFVPTDTDILKRFDAVVDAMNNLQMGDNPTAEAIVQASDTVREQFDYLLGGKVSDGIFAKCGPFTTVKSGNFFFEEVLEGIGNLIESTTKQRINKKLSKARKAAAKYQ
jgi:hypothetical protein